MKSKTSSPPSVVSACSSWGLVLEAPALSTCPPPSETGEDTTQTHSGVPPVSLSHHPPCGLSREGQLPTATALCNHWYSFLVPQFPLPVPSQEAGTPWHIEGLLVAIYYFQASSFHLHFLTAPQIYWGNKVSSLCVALVDGPPYYDSEQGEEEMQS